MPRPASHSVTFSRVAGDPYFRGGPGVRERFLPLSTATSLAYLILPDGGKVEFKATRVRDCIFDVDFQSCTYRYTFQAQAIIDPYGLRSTFAYNGDGTLATITDASNRWIALSYTPGTYPLIDHVTGSDGQIAQYTYHNDAFVSGGTVYTNLIGVKYNGDAGLVASYTYTAPNIPSAGGSFNGVPLLKTCNDVMYSGPMKQILYTYAAGPKNSDQSDVVVGQIQSEKKDTNGQAISSLGFVVNGAVETKADGSSRNFLLAASGNQISSWSDFENFVFANRSYDTKGFLQSTTDRNHNVVNYVSDPISGNITNVTFPLTDSDTTLGKSAATVQYVYGSATCPDTNNRDPSNPYFLYSATDERGNSTIYTRDANKRVAQINYPDGGVETFLYNNFGQVTTHRLRTGGLETYTYSASGLLTEYRDPYHLATADPQNSQVPTSATATATYTYYASGPWVDLQSSVTDGDGHTTNFDAYNSRGQPEKITHPLGQNEAVRSNVQSMHNPDGTLQWTQDELGHRTSYVWDDYKRIRTVTLPPRITGGPTPAPTSFLYDRTGGTNQADYSHTDANPTRITLPSGKKAQIVYDSNLLKQSMTVSGTRSDGSFDSSLTTYTYDTGGNLETITDPNGQTSGAYSTYYYDARNRLTDVDDPMLNDVNTPHKNTKGHTVSYTLDQAGNKVNQLNANNQLISFDQYDQSNRLLQVTVPQTPSPAATTKYTYYPSGLLKDMQDPLLVATASVEKYVYTYDLLGRQTQLQFPLAAGARATEKNEYDSSSGVLLSQTTRGGTKQTFSYDGRHRLTGSTWSDGTTIPSAFTYDSASRVTDISNVDAMIKNLYFDDNTLKSQEEWATADNKHRTVAYTYDVDGNRASIQYPSGRIYDYDYTGRNELWSVKDRALGVYQAAYVPDANGNVVTRYVGSAWLVTDASQRDAMGQIKHLEHRFAAGSGTRTFDYTYNRMGSRTSIKRDGGPTESYGYDLAQEVIAGIETGAATTYGYDANGNRISLNGGPTSNYVANNLNQQTTFDGDTVGYGANGNVTNDGNGGTYSYDAQKRLKSATYTGTGGGTTTFKYDGLNRKISQTTGGVTTYNVWDGWNLIEERNASDALNAPLSTYLYGAGEIVERISASGTTPMFYFQDALGSTSHIADQAGSLKEAYRYSTFGQATYYNGAGQMIAAPGVNDVRHLFTGQLWMPKAAIYDYRHRVYSPTLTRFLQPDPIGFAGDSGNMYRYVRNNPVNSADPTGLRDPSRVYVESSPIPWGTGGLTDIGVSPLSPGDVSFSPGSVPNGFGGPGYPENYVFRARHSNGHRPRPPLLSAANPGTEPATTSDIPTVEGVVVESTPIEENNPWPPGPMFGIGEGLFLAGQPWIQYGAVRPIGITMEGSAGGTSLASVTSRYFLPKRLPFRLLGTRVAGGMVGRAVPYVGAAMMAADYVNIALWATSQPEWIMTNQVNIDVTGHNLMYGPKF